MNEQALVAKVWNYAHVLRDEGVSFGDYLGQISFLLFLKMDEERAKALNEPSAIPADCSWETIKTKSGEALEQHYKEVLVTLSLGATTSSARYSSRRRARSLIRRGSSGWLS